MATNARLHSLRAAGKLPLPEPIKPKPAAALPIEREFPFYRRVQSSEQVFLRWAHGKGIQVGRNGWPDFYCKSPSGGLAAVEVKSKVDDTLRPEQKDNFQFLERLGVQVFVFNPKWAEAHQSGTPIVPWRQYAENFYGVGWPGVDLGGKAAGQSLTSGQQDLEIKPPHENPAPELRIPELLGDPRLLH